MSYFLDSAIINYGGNFGCFGTSSIFFDDSKDLGGTEECLLQYIIKKIKIFSGKKNEKEIIGGIQLIYQNLKSKEIKELDARKGNVDYEDENIDIFELHSGEYLINFFVRISEDRDYICQLGFETNKCRKILKGSDNGENKIITTNGGRNLILATFGHYNINFESIGVLYINIEDYLKKFYKGYFELKFKLKKDEKYKKKIEKSYETLSTSDKMLLKSCLLPDSTFNIIMKYCIFS